VELVDAVELKLDPQRIGARRGQPHVAADGRVLIGGIEPGPVDRVLWSGGGVGSPVAGGDDVRNRIGERLSGEAPDLALEDRVVGGRVDLVDAPIVRRPEIEPARRIVAGRSLSLAGEQPHWIAAAGGVDVVERGAEIHVVGRRVLACTPAQNHVARNVGRFILGNRIGCQLQARTAPRHGQLNLLERQRMVV